MKACWTDLIYFIIGLIQVGTGVPEVAFLFNEGGLEFTLNRISVGYYTIDPTIPFSKTMCNIPDATGNGIAGGKLITNGSGIILFGRYNFHLEMDGIPTIKVFSDDNSPADISALLGDSGGFYPSRVLLD